MGPSPSYLPWRPESGDLSRPRPFRDGLSDTLSSGLLAHDAADDHTDAALGLGTPTNHQTIIACMKKLYAFDFDGTLTTRDTLLVFIRYACGTSSFAVGFLRYLPLLVLMKLGLYPNWKAKQKIFSYFFRDMSLADFNALCQRFAADNRQLLRPQGLQAIADAQAEGADVVIVSASIDNWVQPFLPSSYRPRHPDRGYQRPPYRPFPHQQLLWSGKGKPHPGPLSRSQHLPPHRLRRQSRRQGTPRLRRRGPLGKKMRNWMLSMTEAAACKS